MIGEVLDLAPERFSFLSEDPVTLRGQFKTKCMHDHTTVNQYE